MGHNFDDTGSTPSLIQCTKLVDESIQMIDKQNDRQKIYIYKFYVSVRLFGWHFLLICRRIYLLVFYQHAFFTKTALFYGEFFFKLRNICLFLRNAR